MPVNTHAQINQHTSEHAGAASGYAALSLRDLLDARDQYHIHLMRHPNVVATAIGYYRIRHEDSRPTSRNVVKGTDARTLTNSEIREYSWPAVLVFVDHWVDATEFGHGKRYDPSDLVPKTLYLPDGRTVPVCVIEAPREPETSTAAPEVRYPLNNLGSGNPVLVRVQRQEHVATVACLATDGHLVYALTNRHVTGAAGEPVYSMVDGRAEPIGVSSPLQRTRIAFSDLYPGWPGRSTYVNIDLGLIEVDDVNKWTARLQDGSVMGPLVDLSSADFPLSLVGRNVRGYGAASTWMQAEIHGLFYRYKSRGGFEYVADFFVGPRAARGAPPFQSRPGDSGTLWLLEEPAEVDQPDATSAAPMLRPLAIQWGADRLHSAGSAAVQPYVLATSLSTACEQLDLDLVRDWNLDQPDTWGAVGHFTIAANVAGALSARVPNLTRLMTENAGIISHPKDVILSSDFKGMGSDAFVPMADVPDFFWKHGKQGHSRGMEGPNHFADMDHKRDDGKDLLELCKNAANIDADVWNSFYDSVTELLTGEPIDQKYRGLLPFRVWQIFDEMVEFARRGKTAEFVCAAGVLTHYVGDACQPLHISYLHDGDPLQFTVHTVHHHDGTTSDVKQPLGQGVHSAYEDAMVNSRREDIWKGLAKTPKVKASQHIANGHDAALATVGLMRDTFKAIPPSKILASYLKPDKTLKMADQLWRDFGDKTIEVMKDGTHLLAVLWESAWLAAGRDGDEPDVRFMVLTPEKAMAICAPRTFLPSLGIAAIGAKLKHPGPTTAG